MKNSAVGIRVEREGGGGECTRPVKRAMVRDARLSWGARGLFSFLNDLPSGWQPRKSHLVEFSPSGREHLDRLVKELVAVGAVKIEPRQLSDKEAEELNDALAQEEKTPRYRAGQIVGQTWIVVDPDLWAIEKDLSGKTATRKTRATAQPSHGQPAPKVHQLQGSPILKGSSTTAVVGSGFTREELLEATALAEKEAGRAMGWKLAALVSERFEKNTCNSRDVAAIENLRRSKVAEEEKLRRLSLPPEIDEQSQSLGAARMVEIERRRKAKSAPTPNQPEGRT